MSINRGWYMRNTTRPPRRPAQPSLRVIHLTAGWGLHLTTFECSQSSASSRFLLSYASRLVRGSTPPISGSSRDLVPYNRRTGLRHSGLSCVSVGNHTLVFLTQANAARFSRYRHACGTNTIPIMHVAGGLLALIFQVRPVSL